jgi:hypothetical protein
MSKPASTNVTGGIFEMLRAGGQPTSAMTSIVNSRRAGISDMQRITPCSVHSESLTVDAYERRIVWFGR